MFLVDTLVVIGLASVNLGTIQEGSGICEHTFQLRNDSHHAVGITQGYTSCGCTTIDYPKEKIVSPGDTIDVTLHFNPRGKGGDFHESGIIVYGDGRKRAEVALYGNCITSEETLSRQFPIRIGNHLRLSANHFDLGMMRIGETKERNVVILHNDEDNRQEIVTVSFTATEGMQKGTHHISHPITTLINGKKTSLPITLDFIID